MILELNNIELVAKITEFEQQRVEAIKQGGRVNDHLVAMLNEDIEKLRTEAKKRGIIKC